MQACTVCFPVCINSDTKFRALTSIGHGVSCYHHKTTVHHHRAVSFDSVNTECNVSSHQLLCLDVQEPGMTLLFHFHYLSLLPSQISVLYVLDNPFSAFKNFLIVRTQRQLISFDKKLTAFITLRGARVVFQLQALSQRR